MSPIPLISHFGFKMAAGLMSPPGKRASLLVLIYHRVPEKSDPLLPSEPDAKRFSEQMDLLASMFNVLSLTEAAARLKDGSLPARAACISFDDGYVNNLDVALPILKSRQLPATVFVSTGFIGGGRMWNDTLIETVRAVESELDLSQLGLGVYSLVDIAARRTAIDKLISKLKYLDPDQRLHKVNQIAEMAGVCLPDNLMMSESQIKQLHRGGIAVGAHTVNHPILARLNDHQSRLEIMRSKQILEDITGEPVLSFAYPNGRPYQDYEARHVHMVQECGFTSAVSTAWGSASSGSDVLQLPRIAPWDRTSARFAMRMVKAYVDPVAKIV